MLCCALRLAPVSAGQPGTRLLTASCRCATRDDAERSACSGTAARARSSAPPSAHLARDAAEGGGGAGTQRVQQGGGDGMRSTAPLSAQVDAVGSEYECAPVSRWGALTARPCAPQYPYRNVTRTDCVWVDGIEACMVRAWGRLHGHWLTLAGTAIGWYGPWVGACREGGMFRRQGSSWFGLSRPERVAGLCTYCAIERVAGLCTRLCTYIVQLCSGNCGTYCSNSAISISPQRLPVDSPRPPQCNP